MAAEYDTDYRVSCFGIYGLARRIYFDSKEDAEGIHPQQRPRLREMRSRGKCRLESGRRPLGLLVAGCSENSDPLRRASARVCTRQLTNSKNIE